jgi:2'-5' RNA ligase
LFFALWPDGAHQIALAHAARKAIKINGGRAVPVAKLHLTLVFLGAVPEGRIPELAAIARKIAIAFPAAVTPLQLTFNRLEHWLKPQILCALPAERAEPVAAATSAIHATAALAEALRIQLVDVGFAPDLKPFRAHVTLARKVRRPRGGLEIEASLWSCRQFSLVESRTEAGGALYSVLDSWLLARPQIV